MQRGIIVTEATLVNELRATRMPDYNSDLDLSSIVVSEDSERMSTLPLLFKKEGLVEKHQLEGVDPSDRYFNRMILVNRIQSGYAAKLTYEAFVVESRRHSTIAAAVKEIVEKLQEAGFSRMRTRPNFKGTRYLAEKETWLDYPDRP
jgi:hypothetical protein